MRKSLALLATLVAVSACAAGSPAVKSSAQPSLEAPLSVLSSFPQAPAGPPLPTAALQTIAIGSCLNEEWGRDQKALETITALKPDLMIMMGDNVYGSSAAEDPVLSDLRASYWGQSQRREFTALVSSVPTLAVWDDHDFGKNDGGGDFAQKELARQMFLRFWRHDAASVQRHADGVYGAYQIGPQGQRVQILLLDTRFNRSPLKPTDQRGAKGKERYIEDSAPTNTVLGETQWAWLAQELKKPADLRLIVSSIQILALGHGWEKWGNFPTERARMLNLVRDSGARGVVFLSGDRHYSSIAREPRGGPFGAPYDLYDFTSSAINMPWGAGDDETIPNRITPAATQENFGVVQIDWAGRNLTLETRDKEGKPVFSQKVAFADIGL